MGSIGASVGRRGCLGSRALNPEPLTLSPEAEQLLAKPDLHL